MFNFAHKEKKGSASINQHIRAWNSGIEYDQCFIDSDAKSSGIAIISYLFNDDKLAEVVGTIPTFVENSNGVITVPDSYLPLVQGLKELDIPIKRSEAKTLFLAITYSQGKYGTEMWWKQLIEDNKAPELPEDKDYDWLQNSVLDLMGRLSPILQAWLSFIDNYAIKFIQDNEHLIIPGNSLVPEPQILNWGKKGTTKITDGVTIYDIPTIKAGSEKKRNSLLVNLIHYLDSLELSIIKQVTHEHDLRLILQHDSFGAHPNNYLLLRVLQIESKQRLLNMLDTEKFFNKFLEVNGIPGNIDTGIHFTNKAGVRLSLKRGDGDKSSWLYYLSYY
jgi:hypothetical protein